MVEDQMIDVSTLESLQIAGTAEEIDCLMAQPATSLRFKRLLLMHAGIGKDFYNTFWPRLTQLDHLQLEKVVFLNKFFRFDLRNFTRTLKRLHFGLGTASSYSSNEGWKSGDLGLIGAAFPTLEELGMPIVDHEVPKILLE
ncbi:hypothetical protein ABW19_dt0203485 [Dactylella cylindrospora]|nr:hypothetical protein ABW19_dt0203485 [Dactylella cylindrospora]